MKSSLLNQILSPLASSPGLKRTSNNNDDEEDDGQHSYFQRTVCLHDWWLVKAGTASGAKRLAVAGFTSRELQAMRVFTSAPIVKRYDVFTLETADGVYILVKGFINGSRTIENGFSSEVLNHFLFGFPTYWEAYSEKCLGEECTTRADVAAEDKRNCNPSTSAGKYKVNGRSEHEVEDPNQCSENVSESIAGDPSNQAAENDDIDMSKNHVSECSNFPVTRSFQKMVNSHDLSSEKNFVRKGKNHTSDNCLLAMVCDIVEENSAGSAEASTFDANGSSEKGATPKGTGISNGGMVKKVKTPKCKQIENKILSRGLNSGETPMPIKSDLGSLNVPDMEMVASKKILSADYRITSNMPETSERPKEKDKNEDILNSENRNGFSSSLPQSEAIRIGRGEKLSGADSANLSVSSSFGLMRKESSSSFPNVNVHAVNVSPSNHWSRIITNCLKKQGNHQEKHSMSKGSLECENEILPSVLEFSGEGNLNQCSSCETACSGRKIYKLQSRILENSLGSSKGEEKVIEKISGLKATQEKVSSIPLVSHQTANTVLNESPDGMNISNISDGEFQEPTRNSVADDNSKHVECSSKISQARKPRYNLRKSSLKATAREGVAPKVGSSNTSVQTTNILQNETEGINISNILHCEFQEPTGNTVADDNSKQERCSRSIQQAGMPKCNLLKSNLKAAASERKTNDQIGSSTNKVQRKINFDSYASPHTQGRSEKACIVSPESLSLKRSRSGRLLLPSLDFWRNQIAVYDAGRKITGIQEGLDILEGSKAKARRKGRKINLES